MTEATRPIEVFMAQISASEFTAQRIAEAVAEILDPETSAVSTFENKDQWVTEVVFHNAADRPLIAKAVGNVAGPEAKHLLTFSTINMRDWVASSLEGLAPVNIGRFVIHGAHDRGQVKPNQIGIEIEAALAFGTGHHGTTRGCLLAFEAIRKRNAARNWCVLDIGTGTGVLAIAAARALRQPVVATDIDPIAVAVARENVRLNRVASFVTLITAADADARTVRERGRYDLIFANILEAPLRRLSRSVSDLLRPDGRIILSGLLPAQASGIIAAYRRQALALESRRETDQWVTLVMRNESCRDDRTARDASLA